MSERVEFGQRDEWALLVIDMQNAFCHRDGSFSQMIKDTEMTLALNETAVSGCSRLVAFARAQDRPVIFSRYVYQQNYADRDILLRKYPMIAELKALAPGSWDAQIVDELTPEPTDFLIEKSRYSAFYSTRLPSLLNGLGVRKLVLCGVTTNICVESTARDAAQRDFDVLVIADATGEFTLERHSSALAIMQYGFAEVLQSEDFIKSHDRSLA